MIIGQCLLLKQKSHAKIQKQNNIYMLHTMQTE